MSMTLIGWKSDTHRWAVIRCCDKPKDSDRVSQHSSPREAHLRCQKWIQGDPWTFPGSDDNLNHFYDVEARDLAAALDLALSRRPVSAEDAAAGRVSRFPRFHAPGGKLLTLGEDDERGETGSRLIQIEVAASTPCRAPRPLRRGKRDSENDSACSRRGKRRVA